MADFVSCPLCGESLPRGVRRCDNCGSIIPDETVAGVRALAETLRVDPETARRLAASGFEAAEPRGKPAKASTLYLCPSCGAFVSSGDARCARCGTGLDTDTPPEEARACPHCGSQIPVTAEVCPACDRSVLPADAAESIPRLCPNCGSVAPTGRQTCAVCGASLRPAAPKAAPAPPPERPHEAPPRPPLERKPTPATPRMAPKSVVKTATVPRPRPAAPRPVRKAGPTPRAARRQAPPPETKEPEVKAAGDARARPTPATGASPSARLDAIRELAAVATVLALPATGVASFVGAGGSEWGRLFVFGVLFAIAFVLAVPAVRGRGSPVSGGIWATALILLGAAPLLAGTASLAATAALVLGIAVLSGPVWKLRASAGAYMAWVAGLVLLLGLAIGGVTFLVAGPWTPAMWGVGATLALGAASLVALRRFLRAAVDDRLRRADSEYTRRDFAKAVAQYDGAIRLARRSGQDAPAAWYGKGAALVSLGKFGEAVDALDEALTLNPANEVAWINKGAALGRLGRMADALKCYNSAIKVNPKYEVAWNNKGNALARLGRQELALACYDRAIEIDPAYRTAWVNKGYVLAKLGRFDEAAHCADRALTLTPGVAST